MYATMTMNCMNGLTDNCGPTCSGAVAPTRAIHEQLSEEKLPIRDAAEHGIRPDHLQRGPVNPIRHGDV